MTQVETDGQSEYSGPKRPRRSKGERSRDRILEAAREVAMVSGYDGTSMAEVSRRCGLPTSSIYWHFADKDDLMAKVIEASFREWTASWRIEPDSDFLTQFPTVVKRVLETLRDFPEFLRLGLPLALQSRKDDPAARRIYLQSRAAALANIREIGERHFPQIPDDVRESIVAYCLYAVDGLYIASELDDDVDLERQLAVHAKALTLLISDALDSVENGESVETSTGADTSATGDRAPTRTELVQLASDLRSARDTASAIAPPTEVYPGLGAELAYEVQSLNRNRDLAAGERLVGHKIGLTSVAMQRQLGVAEPDYGYLTDRMVLANGASVARGKFVAPRVEPEIAFRLARDLDANSGPVTRADVVAATDAVAVALEVVDSRISDWRITLGDTIADNASSAAVVLGPWVPLAGVGALAELRGELIVDGELAGAGDGSEVLGDPAEAVAWLINAYGKHGQKVRAGEFVMSGSMCAAAWVTAGTTALAKIDGLGEVGLSFGDEQVAAVPTDVGPVIAAVAAAVDTMRPATPVLHAELVLVRPDSDGDEESSAVRSALESIGIPQAAVVVLRSTAASSIDPLVSVSLTVDGPVDAGRLGAVTAAARIAAGDRLTGEATAAPIGALAAPCPVGPSANAISMTFQLGS